jgi:hypothetical protein
VSKQYQQHEKRKRQRRRGQRPRVVLPPELERYRKIPVPWAAEIKGISVDGFKRYYAHLIEQVSPRRQAVTLGRLLDEPETEQPQICGMCHGTPHGR